MFDELRRDECLIRRPHRASFMTQNEMSICPNDQEFVRQSSYVKLRPSQGKRAR